MRHRYLIAGALGLGSASLTGPAAADSLSCNDRIVDTGDSLYQVRATCGDPDAALHHVEYRTVRVRVPAPCHDERGHRCCDAEVERTVEVLVDDWTYDFGRQRFIEFLHFEDGRLVSINEGGYGYK
jgi:hypothetical protein